MSRFALLVMTAAMACSKSAANQETQQGPVGPTGGGSGAVMAPGSNDQAPRMGGEPRVDTASKGAGAEMFRLKPEEGQLVIHSPGDAKAGTEAVARLRVTPGKGYHVNTEYPIKLTLEPPPGVTVPKAVFTAGGHDKAVGDAEALDDNQLTIAVKLTPGASGSHTVNGSFKFAVCDKDTCLVKKEAVSISFAAK